MSKKSSHSHRRKNDKKNGSKIKQNLIAFAVVLAILAGVLLYIGDIESDYNKNQGLTTTNQSYTLLENNDTLNMARIELAKDISILEISKKFYNDSIFWPYISLANKEINNPLRYNLLSISKGTVLNIPKISSSKTNLTVAENAAQLQRLCDSIMNAIEDKRKPKEAGW